MEFDDPFEEEAALVSASITDEQLEALTGSRDLSTVTFLQMTVDSAHVPLACIGERLPMLSQLKLSGSCLPSVRELGTSLSRLRVLWLCRCGLSDVDGLSALPELQELYLAFNDIAHLSPLTAADQLQVLDLEANSVAEMQQVEFLGLLPSLQELTLRGNPLCEACPAYRARTAEMLPELALLDDDPLTAADRRAAPGRGPASAAADADAPPTPERDARELRMVTQGIKYAEVNRVFDVAADGRATLSGALGGAAGARALTAAPGARAHSALGSRVAWTSRPSTAANDRPGS